MALGITQQVPVDDRHRLLDELRRVSRRFVVLAAPFATPGVRDADALLLALVKVRHGYEHAFLNEHLTHGHPDLVATVEHFEAAGASVTVLPNGYCHIEPDAGGECVAGGAAEKRYARGQARSGRRRRGAYRHLLAVDLQGGTDWCPSAPVRHQRYR
jgi:hypothetical protein